MVETSPAKDATRVSRDAQVKVTFSESVDGARLL
ncbi:Ig-like domain-containing protein [Streptosporangium lutulentum]